MKNNTNLRNAYKAVFMIGSMLMFSLAGCLGDVTEESDVDELGQIDSLVVAYEVRDTYTNIDENPQRFADYLQEKLNAPVELYAVDSEGASIEALRFGHADIAFMDGGSAWVGWQQYDLSVLASETKPDGRTWYGARAIVRAGSDIAEAQLDDDIYTDPFSLFQGKTSCHTGWLKSAGMLLPMGYLIGNGYANVIGDPNTVESMRNTIYAFFNEDASIPDTGDTYYSYKGALRCLSEDRGDIAFVADTTLDYYCVDRAESNSWCLDETEYVELPLFGRAPGHPVMYNPGTMSDEKADIVRKVLVDMENNDEGQDILDEIVNSPGGIVDVGTTEDHLGTYSAAIRNIPGIQAYYGGKYGVNTSVTPTKDPIVIAYEVRDTYENIDANPQILADRLAKKLGVGVELYDVSSEGAIIEALRFGHADIGFMDGGAAWVGWKEYGLSALAADLKPDGRSWYGAQAYVRADSDMAQAFLDDDDSTDPFALFEGKTSCHTGWLKSAGMLLPMGYLIGNGYAEVIGDPNDVASLRDTIYNFFNEDASIPDSGDFYYSYEGALRCLSEDRGDIAFIADTTYDYNCVQKQRNWCLENEDGSSGYVALPLFGKAPSHPVMYNPEMLDMYTRAAILNALMDMNNEEWIDEGDGYCYNKVTHDVDREIGPNMCGDSILDEILNTGGLIAVNTQEHMGSYSDSISNVPGIAAYFEGKYDI
jgi:ABC-type phosphate/phosphonate transport system substrate-binding protein